MCVHGCSDIHNSLVVTIVSDIMYVLITNVLHYFLLGFPHLVDLFLVSVAKQVFLRSAQRPFFDTLFALS